MTDLGGDRRRSARITMEGAESERRLTMSVRVVDISLGGLLMLATRPLAQGQFGHLSTRFGPHPLEADIEIRHVARVSGDHGDYRIGARFVALDKTTRGTMQRYLKNGS